jgi:hypothetical protein
MERARQDSNLRPSDSELDFVRSELSQHVRKSSLFMRFQGLLESSFIRCVLAWLQYGCSNVNEYRGERRSKLRGERRPPSLEINGPSASSSDKRPRLSFHLPSRLLTPARLILYRACSGRRMTIRLQREMHQRIYSPQGVAPKRTLLRRPGSPRGQRRAPRLPAGWC